MKIARTIFGFAFAAGIFFFGACGADEGKNVNRQSSNANQTNGKNISNANANLPKDDVEELAKIIKLPFMPTEAVWREDILINSKSENRPAEPNGRKLVAVLKFSGQDANQIVTQAEKYKRSSREEIDAESWFPAELDAKSQLSGDKTLKGVSYAANDFLQAPFVKGKLTRVTETDFFVLELTSF